MKDDELIALAAECGLMPWVKHEHVGGTSFSATDEGIDGDLAGLIQFAKLVAAHEREACAKVCDDMASKNHAEHHLYEHQIDKGVRLSKAVGLSEGAAAIRARSQ
jgi:hypothetical protein